MKRFEIWNNGKKVGLEILEKVNENKMVVNVTVNGNPLAENVVANICRINTKPHVLYLNFKANEENVFLSICDKKKKGATPSGREIADWIWKNIQDSDNYGSAYGFTTEHMNNWEQE